MTQKQPSLLGGIMIIAGGTIGAGMLANPSATAGVWFTGSLLILIYTWFSMMSSGLMLLEANLHYPTGASFDTIVKDLLGKGWNVLNGLSLAFVMYILTYAYITVGGGITQGWLSSLFNGQFGEINGNIGALVFAFVLAAFVWFSTKAVDRFSTVLIGGMVISFFLTIAGLLSSVNVDILLDKAAPENTEYAKYAVAALPVCLVSFGFHQNVPSLVKYYNRNASKVVKSVFFGTLLALIIYVLWQLAIQGNLPRNEFAPVIEKDGDVAVLLGLLKDRVQGEYVNLAVQLFAYMAIASSFLGVTLGLFDYIADLFGFDDSRLGRAKTALVVFSPPLLLSLLFPFGFVVAIGYAGLAATVWAAIVPALLVKACRKKFPERQYRMFGGNFMVYFVIVFALLNIVTQIAAQFGALPAFKG